MRWMSAAALILAVASPAAADWTKDQRGRFVASCVEGCQSTPNLSDKARAACPKACGCLADQGEKMMTPADFDEADKAAAEEKMTPKMEALAKYFPACTKQALGQ
ncbi:MAG TPA: hypothetical protein VGM96_01800 [Reyranella sp.]|jgi:hypothetical protein